MLGREGMLFRTILQVLLSLYELTDCTHQLVPIAGLVPRLLCRWLSYSSPQLLHVYVTSHTANNVVFGICAILVQYPQLVVEQSMGKLVWYRVYIVT